MATRKTTSTRDSCIIEWTAPPQQGWECPRCGKIWAPWMSSCDCSRNTHYTITCSPSTSTTNTTYKTDVSTTYKTDVPHTLT